MNDKHSVQGDEGRLYSKMLNDEELHTTMRVMGLPLMLNRMKIRTDKKLSHMIVTFCLDGAQCTTKNSF